MATEKEIKRYMRQAVVNGEHVDAVTREVNMTKLAEAAAWMFDIDLDDDDRPFELAFEVAEWYDRLHDEEADG